MTAPAELARELYDTTDLAAAALLVAMADDDPVSVPREDHYLVRELEALGCLHDGKLTELGRRTAFKLMGMGVGSGAQPSEP